MKFAVARATNCEVGEIIDLASKTFIETYETITPFSADSLSLFAGELFTQEKIRAEIQLKSVEYFLCWANNQPVGYAKIVRTASQQDTSCELEKFYLLKAHCQKGMGSIFLNSLKDVMSKRGCHSVWLAVFEKNSRAIQFYEKKGFRKIGTRDFKLELLGKSYCDKDLLYELNLVQNQ